MSAQQTFDGVVQVLGLQISELTLLGTDFNIENVVVDLRDQALQGNTTLDAGGGHQGGRDVARIDEAVGGGGGGMAGGRDLLDALAERATAANDVGDFGLVAIDFDRARAHVISRSLQVDELCFHGVLSKTMTSGWQPVVKLSNPQARLQRRS